MSGTKKEKINNALFVIKCKNCKTILASASEYNLLPNFSTCLDCVKDITEIVKEMIEGEINEFDGSETFEAKHNGNTIFVEMDWRSDYDKKADFEFSVFIKV